MSSVPSFPRNELRDLPKFNLEIVEAERGRIAAIKAKKTDVKCGMVVLAILLATAAGGAALLLSQGGGMPLYGGAALAATSIGLMVWMVYLVRKTKSHNNEAERRFQDLNLSVIGYGDILAAMLEAEVQRVAVQAVVNKMRNADFAQFVRLAVAKPNAATVCSCLKAHEDFQTLDMGLKLQVIDALPEAEKSRATAELLQQAKQLPVDQQLALAERATQEEVNAFVMRLDERQFQALAERVPSEKVKKALFQRAELLDPQVVAGAIVTMTPQEKVEFLTQITVLYQENRDDRLKTHAENVIKLNLTEEFAQSFNDDDIPAESSELLAQFARWPDLVGRYTVHYDLFTHSALLNQFWEPMEPADRQVLMEAIITNLTQSVEDLAENWSSLLTDSTPTLILHLMARTPEVFALITLKRGVHDRSVREARHTLTNVESKLQDYAALRKHAPKEFALTAQKELQDAFSQPQGSRQEHFAQSGIANYLKEFSPKEFRKLVVNNKNLSANEAERDLFTLDLLEYLGNDAPKFISGLDQHLMQGNNKERLTETLRGQEGREQLKQQFRIS